MRLDGPPARPVSGFLTAMGGESHGGGGKEEAAPTADRRPARNTRDDTDSDIRLIGGGELAIAVLALVHITAVIAMRDHFPAAHDVWVALTDLLTRVAAHVFAVIDGHSTAYRPVLSSARIEEMRAIYATNRLFALILLLCAAGQAGREAPAIRSYLATRNPIAVKRMFWLCVLLFPTIPIAGYGLSRGFAEQSFFEFQIGLHLIASDVHYYLDFLMLAVIGWQFLVFLPVTTWFTGRIAYGYMITHRRRPTKRPRRESPSEPDRGD